MLLPSPAGKYEDLEKRKDEEAQRARLVIQKKEAELNQAIVLSDELMSRAEEVGKRCKSMIPLPDGFGADFFRQHRIGS